MPEIAGNPFILVWLAETTSPLAFDGACAHTWPAINGMKAMILTTFSKLLMSATIFDRLLMTPPKPTFISFTYAISLR
jgi:hypothetical protein